MTKKKAGYPRTPEETQNLLKELESKRVENVLMLIKWSFEDLLDLKKNLWYCYKDFDSVIAYEKYSQVDEALQIKEDNEEMPWDCYL
jgi:hypothetical protein